MISAFRPDEACGLELPHQKGHHYFHWTAEVYGLGKAYRQSFGLPPDAYLGFTSDHGVNHCIIPFRGHWFEDHEASSPLHLTFQHHKYVQYLAQRNKRALRLVRLGRVVPRSVIQVQHPYINYWRSRASSVPSRREGTLVFLPHSQPEQSGYDVGDVAEFVQRLRLMPREFLPVGLMIHYHDVRRGALEELAGSGFKLLSAGHPMHPDFVDRLAEAILSYRYVASSRVRTEAFICASLGARFVLLEDPCVDIKQVHHGAEFATGQVVALQQFRTEHLSLGVRVTDSDLRRIRMAAERPRR